MNRSVETLLSLKIMLNVLCRNLFASPFHRGAVADISRGVRLRSSRHPRLWPSRTHFFIIRPRERRMMKKGNPSLRRWFLPSMLNVERRALARPVAQAGSWSVETIVISAQFRTARLPATSVSLAPLGERAGVRGPLAVSYNHSILSASYGFYKAAGSLLFRRLAVGSAFATKKPRLLQSEHE